MISRLLLRLFALAHISLSESLLIFDNLLHLDLLCLEQRRLFLLLVFFLLVVEKLRGYHHAARAAECKYRENQAEECVADAYLIAVHECRV